MLFAALGLVAAMAEGERGPLQTPVQKVVVMIQEMKKKAKKEKEEEVKLFAEFKQWCDDTEAAKAKAVEDGKALAEKFSSDIEKFDSDAKVLGEEIAALDGSISTASEDKDAATK